MILLLLVLIPVLAGLVCLVIKAPRAMERINLAAMVVVAALTWQLAAQVLDRGTVTAFGGFFRADALSAVVVMLTGLVSLVVTVYAVGFMRQEESANKISSVQFHRYYVLTPFFISTMHLAMLVDNLGVMWVAIETSTLVSVLLVMFYNQKTSIEAAWKYIIIGSIGVAMALFGTVITYYSAVGILGPEQAQHGLQWSVLKPLAGKFDAYPMKLAFVFILLGYGTKAGLAPMHTWKPDAYSEAPTPSAALMGAAFVNCAIYAILRFYALAKPAIGGEFASHLLMWFGVASILVAVPFIVVQRNFRRILAYSSIDHTGIMVASAGFGGPAGLAACVLHMTFHATTKPLMFFCAGNVQQEYDTPHFRKVTGLIRVLPRTAVLFLAATLAVTGTPPFSLFQSEFLVLSAGIHTGHVWAVGLILTGLVSIFAGFLAHMIRLNLGPATGKPAPPQGEGRWKIAGMALTLLPMLCFAVAMPNAWYQLILRAARLLEATP